MSCINIVFPNQLFEKVDYFDGNEVVLVEEFLFFKQFNFHKKKLVFHRNSMKNYEDYLIKSGFNVEYIETSSKFSDIRHFISNLDNTKTIRDAIEKSSDKQDEEHRVWYVGVTRTKQNLYIMAAKKEDQGYDIESLG